ncbi:MAG: Cna B-type domain-containing protein [Fenollaria massiliensis]
MDNRLVYDEIIINHTRKKYKEAEDAAKTNRTEFKGNKEYFFLDQINRIFLGVNPNYKDYRFVPAGKDFMITREDIEEAIKSNNEGTITKGTGENAISYKVTYDPNTAQIKIKVFDAFYKKNTDTNTPNHFENPVQKGYQKWLKDFNDGVDGLTTNSVDEFKNAFNSFIEKTYTKKSDCFGVLKEKFEKMIEEINADNKLDDDAKKAKIKEFKKAFKAELEKLDLAYLDSAKNGGDYKFDDMRFNALRIELEAGQTIGGAMDSTKKKYLGITSVIVPDVDIPFTDEFGDKLTNKDLYLHKAIEDIKKDKKFDNVEDKNFNPKTWDQSEDTYKRVMAEAYRRVNKEKKFKDLVDVKETNKEGKKNYGIEKYTVKHGNEFAYDDFAIGEGADKKSLKDKAGRTVNPYYVGDGENYKTAKDNVDELLKIYEDKIDKDAFTKSQFYQDLINPEIEIGLYYMHALGYNRAKFANKANYKLNKVGQGPGIFGQENNWKNKVCYPGIGQCIENAGGNKLPGEEGNKAEDEKKMKAEDDFSLSYSPATPNFESENPKFDKRSETGKIDFSNEKDKNKKVDYTVELTVDKLKTDQKIGGDSTKPIDPKAAAEEAKNYNKRGYFVYKNSLIIDFLPEIFRFENGSSMTLTIDEKALTANGANKYDGFNINEFKAKAKPIYVENVYEYLKTLSGDQKTALEKAIALAEEQGKLDRNGNKHAVLAWLPDFEAPHGSSKPQFTLKINQLVVDKKQFKEYEAHKYSGEKFTNHAVFDIFYANHPITITDGHKGNVDKTMRIYDEKGNIVNKDKAEEWFRGYVELKFGDQYDYKIKYKHVKPGYEDINSSNRDKKAEFVDFFATKDKNNGFRPVLRELLDLKNGYYAEYSLDGETFLSKEEIQAKIANNKISLGDILGVKIKHERGFEINKEVEFVLPMMIPNLDAKVENGKVYYIGQDGKRVELGKAEDFFKLDQLKKSDKDSEMYALNSVEGSNTVTVYLEKERFLRVFKEFFEYDGKTEIKKDRPEVRFEIKQIEKGENGKVVKEVILVDKDGKPIQLVVNEKNNFTDMVDHLPIFKKTTKVDEKGNVTVKKVEYEYKLVEKNADGYDVEYEILDNGKDQLGFVIKAKNTEKPEIPPEYPKDHPKNVKVKITVNKVWRVLKGGETPSIQVELYANGEATGKIITLGADGSWSASFEDLPSKDANGKEIIYTVREIGESNELTKIDDRTFEVIYTGNLKDGFTIINKEIPPDDEKPKDKKEPKKHKPNDEEGRDRTPKKNRIPKTGVNEDLGAIYFAFVLLLGLVFIKKRYLVK